MEDQIKAPQTQKNQAPQKNKHIMVWILSGLLVIALAGVGWLGWQLKLTMDQSNKNADQNKQLQSQVTDLTKKLQDAQKSSSSVSTTTTPCITTVSQTLKNNIHDAVTSKNYAALQGYMADSVTVVYAASEKGGAEGAAQAVADLNYLSNGTAPWDFNLPAATINLYKAHFYHQYFEGTVYVGKSSDSLVVSFGFDCNGKINRIFVSAAESILTVD